jgi:hypothetical protein
MPELEEKTLFDVTEEEGAQESISEEEQRRKQMADEFREKYKIERDK